MLRLYVGIFVLPNRLPAPALTHGHRRCHRSRMPADDSIRGRAVALRACGFIGRRGGDNVILAALLQAGCAKREPIAVFLAPFASGAARVAQLVIEKAGMRDTDTRLRATACPRAKRSQTGSIAIIRIGHFVSELSRVDGAQT